MNHAPLVSSVDRIPPNNLEAEKALLGAILVDGEMMATVRDLVQPSDFYASLHETIFSALRAVYDRGEPLDKVALAEELRLCGMLDNVGGMAYLSSLMEAVPTASSATYYARLVREKAVARGLIHAGIEITQLGYEGESDVAGAATAAEERVRSVVESLQGVDEDETWMPRSALDIAKNGVPPVEYDIERLVVSDDGPVLVVGPPESYKSWLALEATRCMVMGEPFAGRFQVKQRPFGIFVNLDAGKAAIERRVYLTACKHPNLLVVSPGEWDPRKFERLLSTHPGAFVTIDCFSDVFRQDPNQDPAEAMREFLRDLRSLYAKYRCNGMVVDHAKRSNGGKGSTPDYYGSVQKKGAIRQMWIVEPVTPDEPNPVHGQARVICEKMSEAEKFNPFVVDLTFGEDSVAVTLSADSISARPRSAEDDMLELIEVEGPVTREQLGATGGKSKRTFDKLLGAGKVKLTDQKAGRKLLYWTPTRIVEALQSGSLIDPVRSRPGSESDNHAENESGQPSDPIRPDTLSSPDATAPRVSGSVATERARTNRVTGSFPIGDPVQRPGSDLSLQPTARDGFTLAKIACSRCGDVGRVRPSDGLCKACATEEIVR